MKELKYLKMFENFTLNDIRRDNSGNSYEEWVETAESEKTYVLNHGDTTRDVYRLPDGTEVYDHYVSPYNFLKKPYCYTVVDLILPINSKTEKLVKNYGGYIDENFGYTEAGYGLPVFKDDKDSLKIAFNFVKNEKEKIINNQY